jgi:hypothetical protein
MLDTRFCHGRHQSRFEASAKHVGFMVYGSLEQRIVSVEKALTKRRRRVVERQGENGNVRV